MPTNVAAAQAGGHPALQEAGLEVVKDDPRNTGGFSLPDFSDPAQLEYGDMPFEVFKGKASIAQANVSWRYRVPEEPVRDAPVIITHGLGAKQGVYSHLADFLAGHGIPTAEYKATHWQNWLAGLHPKHVFDASRLLYQAPWGVIRDIQGRDDIETPKSKFSIVGHSLGGRTAVQNALQHLDSIDGVVAVDSIGLEDHNLPELALRLPGFMYKEFRPVLTGGELGIEEKARLVAGGLLYFAEHPWRGAGEILSLSRSRIGDDLSDLSDSGKGTSVIASPQDTLVNADEEEGYKSDVFVRLPEIERKTLDHMGMVRHPEVYGRTIVSVLEHFDSRIRLSH